jgi:hypothetical protein
MRRIALLLLFAMVCKTGAVHLSTAQGFTEIQTSAESTAWDHSLESQFISKILNSNLDELIAPFQVEQMQIDVSCLSCGSSFLSQAGVGTLSVRPYMIELVLGDKINFYEPLFNPHVFTLPYSLGMRRTLQTAFLQSHDGSFGFICRQDYDPQALLPLALRNYP